MLTYVFATWLIVPKVLYESTVLTNDFSPENVTVDHESLSESQVFQPLIEDSEEEELNLSLSPETRTNNADTIEGCVHNCHCGELNAKLLEKIESLQIMRRSN